LRPSESFDWKKHVNSIKHLLLNYSDEWTTIGQRNDIMKIRLCILEVLMDVQNYMLCGLPEITKKVMAYSPAMGSYSTTNPLSEEKHSSQEK
jgi:hypothetical protein